MLAGTTAAPLEICSFPTPDKKKAPAESTEGLSASIRRLEEFAASVPGDEGAGEERPQPHRPEHLRLAQHAVDQAGDSEDDQGTDDVAADVGHVALAVGDGLLDRAGVDDTGGEGRD